MVLTNWLIDIGGGNVAVVYGYEKIGIDLFKVYGKGARRYFERRVTGRGLRAILAEALPQLVLEGLA